jgi:CBS domain-containing protein/anti-sigma regulatory factor (Ser/Thr protein kinase)
MSSKELTKIKELAFELKVAEAMTRDVYSVNKDSTISELGEVFRSKRISGVPVMEDGNLLGIISLEDFIKSILNGEHHHNTTEEKMTRQVETLYSDDPLAYAINKFEKFDFGRFPVLDRQTKKLVGIITKGDIIRTFLKKLEIQYHEEEIQKYRASHIFHDISADFTTLIFEYNIKSNDFQSAGQASSRLKKSLFRLGILPDISRRAAIATFEAEMNIVIFSRGGKITAYVHPNKIRIIAEDNGPGIEDIDLAMQPGYSTSSSWVREMGFGAGMGLPNIKKCSDILNINSQLGKGTELEITIIERA